MATTTEHVGYIVTQFDDETTRKYEMPMPESGLEGFKTRIATMNTSMAHPTDIPNFALTFISSEPDTQTDLRRMRKIIEAGVTITETEVLYSSSNF